jgi:hypothetical protein
MQNEKLVLTSEVYGRFFKGNVPAVARADIVRFGEGALVYRYSHTVERVYIN